MDSATTAAQLDFIITSAFCMVVVYMIFLYVLLLFILSMPAVHQSDAYLASLRPGIMLGHLGLSLAP